MTPADVRTRVAEIAAIFRSIYDYEMAEGLLPPRVCREHPGVCWAVTAYLAIWVGLTVMIAVKCGWL